jgi:hypothetical protein
MEPPLRRPLEHRPMTAQGASQGGACGRDREALSLYATGWANAASRLETGNKVRHGARRVPTAGTNILRSLVLSVGGQSSSLAPGC